MSRYTIQTEKIGNTIAFRLQDQSRRAEALLYPEFGNNCTEFRTTPGPDGRLEDGTECGVIDIFVPPVNVEDLQHNPSHAGQPILFPFPNRVRDGLYSFDGKQCSMEHLLSTERDKGAGHAIHGLVNDKSWTVEEDWSDETGAYIICSLQLDSNPQIFEQYPFPCKITVTYALREGVLEMKTEVLNTGSSALPMGLGIHPWFPVALRPGLRMPEGNSEISMETRATAEVHVPAKAMWELDKLMPTGRVVPLSEMDSKYDVSSFAPLNDTFFDHVFTRVEHRPDGWSEGGLRDTVSGLEMYVEADAGFREWVLYAPETRPVIALEPYTCTTDAVNLEAQGIDTGLISLAPGDTWNGIIRFGLRLA